MIDFAWQEQGGILLDAQGDIALTSADGSQSLMDMVRTRLKAAFRGWQLYPIGAGLSEFHGRTTTALDVELEMAIKRRVADALSLDFLDKGSFDIELLSTGPKIFIFVYLDGMLISRAVIAGDNRSVSVELQ